MIIEYHRPKTISEALKLLARNEPVTYALGGGTVLNQNSDEKYAVVDLQDLGLGGIAVKGNSCAAGSTATLQEVLEFKGLADDLYRSIEHEASYNLRQMATIAGMLVSADGRSPLTTALLALDASLGILSAGGKTKQVHLGEWLLQRHTAGRGDIISQVSWPANVQLGYEYVARTPADKPIVCAAVAIWPSRRTRLALGGWGEAPTLAMDRPEAGGIENAACNAYSQAGDQWASADYREEIAGILARRCLEKLKRN
jgi:CO/xanthine dehydrogenase FAD-binding subunit